MNQFRELKKLWWLLLMALLVVSFLLLLGQLASAQPVLEIIKQKNKNYYRLVADAEKELNKGRGRGTGEKQFERWKYEQQFHIQPDGTFLPENYDQFAYLSAPTLPPMDTATWQQLGPYQWNATKGWNPGVGRVSAIAVHPLDTTIVYVTSPGGGVWKSTTNGNSWTCLTDGNAAWQEMYSVAVDPTNVNIVYAGNNAGQLIKSTNGGTTWTSVGRYLSGPVMKILINSSNPSLIFVGAQNGIFKSTDAGVTWVKVFANSVEDIEFKPGDPNIMYATSGFTPSVVRSTDGGNTWVGLTANEGITFNSRSLVAVSPADPNKVYVAQAYGVEFGRLYVSTNSGASFSVAVTGSAAGCTNFFGYETTGCGTGGQAGYDMALTVNPTNANEVYLGGVNVWKSTNGGTSFTCQTQWSFPPTGGFGYTHADIHVLEIAGGRLYVGSDGGIYKLQGTTWKDLSVGLNIRQFYRIDVKNGFVTGGAQDNGSSLLRAGKWYDWLGADGMEGLWLDTNRVYGTSQFGTMYKSTDQGRNYTYKGYPVQGNWVTPYVFSNGHILAGYDGVYRIDTGTHVYTKLSGTAITAKLNTLAVMGNYIYASASTTLWRSKNGGTSWSSVIAPSTINDIAIDSTDPEKIYLACNSTSNRVFYSYNAGDSLENISDGLPSYTARTLYFDNDTLYAGMNVGVFRRTGGIWTNVTRTLPLVAVNDLEYDRGYLYAATYGRGLWRMNAGDTSGAGAIVIDTSSGGGGGGIDTTVVDTTTYYLNTLGLTVSTNRKFVHSINWSFNTNDIIRIVRIEQSTDNVNFTTICSGVNTATGNCKVSTIRGVTYYYRLFVQTARSTATSATTTVVNPNTRR